jgi:RimJ/RimL family protein N-acetyltransferase
MNEHCKFLLLQFAFETIGFERVEFRADNRNKRSIAAMQKIGCTVEGILRNHLPTGDGSRRDSIVLSMLMGEWPSIKEGFLARIKMLDQNK